MWVLALILASPLVFGILTTFTEKVDRYKGVVATVAKFLFGVVFLSVGLGTMLVVLFVILSFGSYLLEGYTKGNPVIGIVSVGSLILAVMWFYLVRQCESCDTYRFSPGGEVTSTSHEEYGEHGAGPFTVWTSSWKCSSCRV